MTVGFMNYTNFDEYISKQTFSGERTWLHLAADLLHQGNVLFHKHWRVTAFDSIAIPSRHTHAWLFEDSTVKFAKGDKILLYRDAGQFMKEICDDPYQWTVCDVPLPDMLNAYCNLLAQMEQGVVFRHVAGEIDYCGGQTYTATIWHLGRPYWELVHVEEMYESMGVGYGSEDDWEREDVFHVRWVDTPLEKYLFKLNANHPLTKFEPCEVKPYFREKWEGLIKAMIDGKDD